MSARIRVAFVHDSYPEYRRPLFARLAEKFDLQCFFLNQDDSALPPDSVNVRGYRIPEMSDLVIAPALAGELLGAHARKPFDVVLCPEPSSFSALAAGGVARRLRLPHVVFSGEWYPARHPRRWLTFGLERSLVRGAACCLAYGTRVRERLAGLGADPEKILITGNASPYRHTPCAPAEIETARREWEIGVKPVILFLGRLLAFKAPEILVDAFSIVRREIPSFLLLAGDGPRRELLHRQARRLGLTDLRIAGSEVRGDRQKDLLYSLCSVFVLPSRKGRIAEPWGLVLNEAASAGLPIVTTDGVGAAPDLIRDGETGRVVNQGDARALAEAITGLLLSPKDSKTFGARAKARAGEFSIDRMAETFGRAFERAAGEAP
ncbi:MAG: glycosyltransferase family 4 protein [Anaerolineales bacterium]|nr:glycosyltransferase family 4 protein [Anaerolineales bacterium]